MCFSDKNDNVNYPWFKLDLAVPASMMREVLLRGSRSLNPSCLIASSCLGWSQLFTEPREQFPKLKLQGGCTTWKVKRKITRVTPEDGRGSGGTAPSVPKVMLQSSTKIISNHHLIYRR